MPTSSRLSLAPLFILFALLALIIPLPARAVTEADCPWWKYFSAECTVSRSFPASKPIPAPGPTQAPAPAQKAVTAQGMDNDTQETATALPETWASRAVSIIEGVFGAPKPGQMPESPSSRLISIIQTTSPSEREKEQRKFEFNNLLFLNRDNDPTASKMLSRIQQDCTSKSGFVCDMADTEHYYLTGKPYIPGTIPNPYAVQPTGESANRLGYDDFTKVSKEREYYQKICDRNKGSECEAEQVYKTYVDEQRKNESPNPTPIFDPDNPATPAPAQVPVAPQADKSFMCTWFRRCTSEESTAPAVSAEPGTMIDPSMAPQVPGTNNPLGAYRGRSLDNPLGYEPIYGSDPTWTEPALFNQNLRAPYRKGFGALPPPSPAYPASEDLDYLDRLQNPEYKYEPAPVVLQFPECDLWNIRCQFGWDPRITDFSPREQPVTDKDLPAFRDFYHLRAPYELKESPSVPSPTSPYNRQGESFGVTTVVGTDATDLPVPTWYAPDVVPEGAFQVGYKEVDPCPTGGCGNNPTDDNGEPPSASLKPTREFSAAVPSPDSRSDQGMVASAFGAFFGFKK